MTIITKSIVHSAKKILKPVMQDKQATPLPVKVLPQDLEADTHTPQHMPPFRHLEYLMCAVGVMLMVASLTVLFLYAASGYIEEKTNYLLNEKSNLEDLEDSSYIREAYIMNQGNRDSDSSFMERFKIGNDDNSYAKIDVPDFRDGRRGRFIHDFNMNQTGIMDPEGKRCFIMPLNRSAVLPPRSLLDLIDKMSNGYYDVDMSVAKQTMRVVLPPIDDFSNIGTFISMECRQYPTYRLEKFVGGVMKRSVNEAGVQVFTQFAGKGFQELDIMNIDDVLKYEAENTK